MNEAASVYEIEIVGCGECPAAQDLGACDATSWVPRYCCTHGDGERVIGKGEYAPSFAPDWCPLRTTPVLVTLGASR